VTQHVNLYQIDRGVSGFELDVRLMLRVCAAAGLALMLVYAQQFWRAQATTRSVERLTLERDTLQQAAADLGVRAAAIAKDPALIQAVADLSGELAGKRRMLSALAGPQLSSPGFSAHMSGLARQHVDGLWLRRIRVVDGGASLELIGSSLDAEAVPRLLERLALEPAYVGREFRVFTIEADDESEPVVHFRLSTSPGGRSRDGEGRS